MDPDQKSAIRKELGISAKNFVIGTVGSLVECKGQKFLLEAVAIIQRQIPQIKCIIVGNGPLMGSLRALAAKLDLTKEVMFTGFHPDTLAITSAMDFFVLPSLSEGFSYAALEAMALGKPTIASGVGGLKDFIHDGENGLLVLPGEPEKIAEAVIELYNDRAHSEQLARRAVEEACTVFTVENMVKNTIKYYEELLNKTKR